MTTTPPTPESLSERLRQRASEYDIGPKTMRLLKDAAVEIERLRSRGYPGDTTHFCKCRHPNLDHKVEHRHGNVSTWGCTECECERFTADWDATPQDAISQLRAAETSLSSAQAEIARLQSEQEATLATLEEVAARLEAVREFTEGLSKSNPYYGEVRREVAALLAEIEESRDG